MAKKCFFRNLQWWQSFADSVFSLAGNETFSDQHKLTSLSIPNDCNMMPLSIIDQSVLLEWQEGILNVREEWNLNSTWMCLQHHSSLVWYMWCCNFVECKVNSCVILCCKLNPQGNCQTVNLTCCEWNDLSGCWTWCVTEVQIVIDLDGCREEK